MSPGGLPSTVLPAADPVAEARSPKRFAATPAQRRDAVAGVVADHPRFVAAWAALGDAAADTVERYAAYRVGYHRGLDALRANGWRGSGYVRWAEPTNVGFLRCLRGCRRWRRPSARPTRPSAAPSSSSSSIRPARLRDDGPGAPAAPCCAAEGVAGSAPTRRSSRSTADRWPSGSAACSSPPAASRWSSSGETATGSRRRRAGSSSPTRGRARARSAASSMPCAGSDRGLDGGVVAACDLPDLTVEAVQAVAARSGAAVAVAERWHPALASGRSPRRTTSKRCSRPGSGPLHEALDALGATRRRRRGRLHNVNRPEATFGD